MNNVINTAKVVRFIIPQNFFLAETLANRGFAHVVHKINGQKPLLEGVWRVYTV